MRSDQQLNNERLIQAAAALLATSPGSISVADIAKEANLSVATAYRHFDSVDGALHAYRRDMGLRFAEFSLEQTSSGLVLLEAVNTFWVDLVLDKGAALVHNRSVDGFLSRYTQREEYMVGQIDALQRPLRELTQLLGLETLPAIQDEAAFLWNVLFDPREIFDLHKTAKLTSSQISRRLTAALGGALSSWASAKTPDKP